jgi:hypothetical protein
MRRDGLSVSSGEGLSEATDKHVDLEPQAR